MGFEFKSILFLVEGRWIEYTVKGTKKKEEKQRVQFLIRDVTTFFKLRMTQEECCDSGAIDGRCSDSPEVGETEKWMEGSIR